MNSVSQDGSVDSDGGSEGGSQRERESGTWRNVLQDNPLARRIKEWQQGKLPFGVSFGGNGSPHAGAQPGSDGRGGRGAPGPADSVQSLELSRSSAEQVRVREQKRVLPIVAIRAVGLSSPVLFDR